jgi:hypothetical protein
LRHGEPHFAPLAPFPQVFSVWLAALAIYPGVRLYWASRYADRMRKNNCQPAPCYPHRDPVLGYCWMKRLIRALETNKLMSLYSDAFRDIGNTFWVNTFGEWILMTTEPENIKAVYATNFEAWSMSGPRQKTTEMAIGPHSIISTNGKEWQWARAMIRPSFVRDQVSDLGCFERHVSNLIANIPRKGIAVDLQPLFYMMTMDSVTDFMWVVGSPFSRSVSLTSFRFGQSSSTLTSPSPEATEFIEAFDYSLFAASNRSRLDGLAS